MATQGNKKSFSPEVRAEALQLINEGKLTQKEVALQIGCSVAALQKWRSMSKTRKKKLAAAKRSTEPVEATAQKVKKTRKTRKTRRRRRSVVLPPVAAPLAENPQVVVDAFIQNYWAECADAKQILCLPPDATLKTIQCVNNALRYAYRELHEK
jgi:transposase-like protein